MFRYRGASSLSVAGQPVVGCGCTVELYKEKPRLIMKTGQGFYIQKVKQGYLRVPGTARFLFRVTG